MKLYKFKHRSSALAVKFKNFQKVELATFACEQLVCVLSLNTLTAWPSIVSEISLETIYISNLIILNLSICFRWHLKIISY